ncbi:MAG TPA: hypothetical protein PLX20_00455 [Rhodocyclaceae bacterium]|nr:hypothetical protein [Rhodocyclaceae bacterium]HMV52234.1 hypothetical protein [Rhodocyclaceae bacterium]HMZ83432.1 hypothetical protein [Rhodocyclaceae bacterium]HNA02540.1 hypothetical protein [Rhodocyclaceae bacterium]HNB77241.1 hypothetical protein [Rhodocyclaceae bacterium]
MRIKCLPILIALLFAVPPWMPPAAAKPAAKASTARHGKGKPTAATGVKKAVATRGKKSKSGKGRRAPPAAPTVQGDGAATPVRADPVVPKSVPTRAYAADPQSFYLNGQRIRVRGAPFIAPEGSELGKQRLQKALDGGDISLVDRREDADGTIEAVVRVNGRDVADLLLLDEIRSGNLP